MSKKIPIIMDCDPGHDDAIALILAFASKKLDVKAVTIVAGNQTLEKTSNNALRVLSYAGIDVEVAKGASRPLIKEISIAPSVHGDSGLDGPELPAPTLKISERPAITVLSDHIEKSSEKVTLVPTAPLTNIANLITSRPDLLCKIDKIVLMGGAAVGGNWGNAAAEFNIWQDPHAAKIVFNSGIPIVMCGIDVTHKAKIYRKDIERIRNVGTRVAIMVAELLDFFLIFHEKEWGFDFLPLHDPCTIAYLIDPSIFVTEPYHVDIETQGELTCGMTVVDFNNILKKPKNAQVVMEIDRDKFVDMLVEAVATYS